MMPMVVDTHVHVYPDYELGAFLPAVATRLRALVPGAVPAICLTERKGQHVFQDLATTEQVGRLQIERIEGNGGVALCVRNDTGPLYLLPGRQVATAERLEVLLLGRDLELPDGETAHSLIKSILAVGGIPVLTWALGKWWFARSRQVRALLRHFAPERLWIGDTTLRPREWVHGRAMRRAIAAGTRVLAGGDPLPHPAEAHCAGRYATLLNVELNPDDPVGSIIRGFRVLPPGGHPVGARCSLPTVLNRLWRYRLQAGR